MMKRRLSPQEAKAWQARWKLVNEFEKEELRRTPLDLKLQQFNTLLGWARQLGWEQELAREEAEVRERWIRLRKAYRG
jgi:hypothetical protein